MGKKEVIKNEDKVLVYTDTGNIVEWRMGELKNSFLSKKLKYGVLFVEVCRKKKYYKIEYRPTKGFAFYDHDPTIKSNNDKLKNSVGGYK